MILLIKLKSSPDVYHYQSVTLEQMILSRNLKSYGAELIDLMGTKSSSKWRSDSSIHHSILCWIDRQQRGRTYWQQMCRTYWPCETEIITRCISLSIIHTGADDSINKYEIVTGCIWLLFIHTWADDSINISEIITKCISLSTEADDSMKNW